MKRKRAKTDVIKNILSIVSVAVVALFIILIFKLTGGLLGLVLGTIAVAALIYWLKEIKGILTEGEAPSPKEAEWFFDLIEDEKGVTIIAKVPGPEEKVKVRLVNEYLEIKGGADFNQKVRVPKNAKLQDISYINGVLEVKLQTEITQKKKTRFA